MFVDVRVIGLCLLLMNGTGFEAVLPDWDHGAWIKGPNLPDHVAIVAVPMKDVVHLGGGWKEFRTFWDQETKEYWIYVVIEGESVRFDNVARNGRVPSVPAGVPGLRGLCGRYVGIQPKYLTPGTGAGAHVYFTRGVAIADDHNGRVDTLVSMYVPNGRLRLNAGGDKTLTIRGNTVRVANFPREMIEAGNFGAEHVFDNHFLAYYKMASTWFGRRCKAMPGAHHGLVIFTLGGGCSNARYP
jgi:hypothetical protein